MAGLANIIRLTKDCEVYPGTVDLGTKDKKGKRNMGNILKKGILMREWYDSGRPIDGEKKPRTFTERADGQGYRRPIPEDSFEIVDPLKPHWKDFQFLHDAMMYGVFWLPNFEAVWSDDPVGMAKTISGIACGGGAGATGVGHVLLDPYEFNDGNVIHNHTRWARAFPSFTQGGNLTGSGQILLYDVKYGKGRVPIAGRYSLCKHEYVKQPTGQEHRGYHRGRCSKCELDMSVDSSD